MITADDIFDGLPLIFKGTMFMERIYAEGAEKPRRICEFFEAKECVLFRGQWHKPGAHPEPRKQWRDSLSVQYGYRPPGYHCER